MLPFEAPSDFLLMQKRACSDMPHYYHCIGGLQGFLSPGGLWTIGIMTD